MKLTKEQAAIIHSSGNIKINAVAGSGKTTTVIEYAKARPSESKILYVAFNKSVKIEAVKKFAAAGLSNVRVETAHSLAYKNIVFKHSYKVKNQAYKINEIATLLGLQSNGEKHNEYIVANHINKFIAYFCNSDKQKVQDLNYLDIVTDTKAQTFVKAFYPYIEIQTRLLLSKMDKGQIEITHDFYLKKFQLSKPQLGYDFILFDEGQDASAAMLDIFLQQQASKVIVGDTHQQIYGWRHAVNSLEKTDFTTFQLNTSFRFAQPIADIAMQILQWKNLIGNFKPIQITGKSTNKPHKTKAILARTNLGLLLKAIETVTEKNAVKSIYFEGNINSYTYADDGASLYDVLNLYNKKHSYIRDTLIKAMADIDELEEYIEKAEDAQLAMMVEIVKEYGNEIPDIIKAIKDKHVANDDKEKAQIIFSTVHRCKGMEYDDVELVNDFINEKKLEKNIEDNKQKNINNAKLYEEINLLYVAITRTKNILRIPETLVPKGFATTAQIVLLKVQNKEELKNTNKSIIKNKNATSLFAKKYTVEKITDNDVGAYKPWTDAQDAELKRRYQTAETIAEIAEHYGRTKGAIYARVKKLGLKI